MPITDLNPKYTEKKVITHTFIVSADTREHFDAELDLFEIMREEITEVVKKHSTQVLR